MSPTATTSDVSAAELTDRVNAAAALFPGDGLVAGPADSQETVSELLPSDDALVLIADVPDTTQQVLAIVNPALLVGMGLSDADGLAANLAPVLEALTGGAPFGEAKVGVGTIGLGEVPPSSDDALLVAAGLFLGAEHVATLGVSVTRAAPVDDEPETGAPEVMDLPEVDSPRHQTTAVPVDATGGPRSLNLLRNVEMNVTAELGRTRMTVAELLSLTPGSVVELDRSAGTPIDVLVNGTLIARGEVVVIDEEFGVRISEIVDRVEGI